MPIRTADAVVTADAVAPTAAQVLPRYGIAVANGRVLAVAPRDELRALIGPRTAVHKLSGLLLPGFFDSHNHLLMTGLGMLAPSLAECRSIADVLAVVQAAATHGQDGDWIVPSPAWHESSLAEARMPTAEELDTVSAGRPAFMRRGGHNVVLNTHALRLLDVERTSAGEEGATVVRRADGLPTGHIVGTAYVGRLAARCWRSMRNGSDKRWLRRAARMRGPGSPASSSRGWRRRTSSSSAGSAPMGSCGSGCG